jgi:hypothetical protein
MVGSRWTLVVKWYFGRARNFFVVGRYAAVFHIEVLVAIGCNGG